MDCRLIVWLCVLAALFSIRDVGATLSGPQPVLLAPQDLPEMAPFLREAESILPPTVRNFLRTHLETSLKVRFEKEDGSSQLLVPRCYDWQGGLGLSDADRTEQRQTLGEDDDEEEIVLNRLFIPVILRGDPKTSEFSCSHHNFYRLALATVLHELTHVYDALLAEEGGRLSSSPQFRALTGWVKQGVFFKTTAQSNFDLSASPDPDEFESPRESLAVNQEYFLLDPEFKCRRPAVFQFLSRSFDGFDPFPDRECSVPRNVPLSDRPNQLVTLDPERVYQIHYLFAAKGDALMSRWGHAMIRLVLCAPGHPLGPVCLNDTSEHLILSYQADVAESQIRYWDGLAGKYQSLLAVTRMDDVITHYTHDEFRDVISLPLKLNREEIQAFVDHALEQYWAYQGKYYFLTNNCASEAANAIRAALGPSDAFSANPISPLGLYHALAESGFIDPSLVSNPLKAVQEGYYFFSNLKVKRAVFRKLKEQAPELSELSDLKFNEYLSETSAIERRKFFEDFKNSGVASERVKSTARLFLALESHILKVRGKMLDERAFGFIRDILAGRKNLPIPDFVQDLKGILDSSPSTPSSGSGGGYGIPLGSGSSLTENEKSSSSGQGFQRAMHRFQNWVEVNFSTSYWEVRRIQENNLYFYKSAQNSFPSGP